MKLKQSYSLFILLFIMLCNIEVAHAETTLPSSYGAKGALQDTTITLDEALTYAIQDEYLAQARYDKIISIFGAMRPFTKIKSAEQRHISELLPLFAEYKVKLPENDAAQYVIAPTTLKEAFQAGISGEIDNIKMYEKFTANETLPDDVKRIMSRLGEASKDHLKAFERGLRRIE